MNKVKAKNPSKCEEEIKVHVGTVVNIPENSTISGNIQTTDSYHFNIKVGYEFKNQYKKFISISYISRASQSLQPWDSVLEPYSHILHLVVAKEMEIRTKTSKAMELQLVQDIKVGRNEII